MWEALLLPALNIKAHKINREKVRGDFFKKQKRKKNTARRAAGRKRQKLPKQKRK
jgi:hypothetical protein